MCNDKIQELEERIERLRCALHNAMDFVVFPARIKRLILPGYRTHSAYEDGWNACVIEAVERMKGILRPGDWSETDD